VDPAPASASAACSEYGRPEGMAACAERGESAITALKTTAGTLQYPAPDTFFFSFPTLFCFRIFNIEPAFPESSNRNHYVLTKQQPENQQLNIL
jgi:hypothetical protein